MINEYIDEKKNIYDTLLEFFENPDFNEEDIMQVAKIIQKNKYDEDREEFEHFLKLFVKFANNIHRAKNFLKKIEHFIRFYGDKIKNFFTNFEIFQLFQSNKMILLYLIENNILTVDENISNGFINENYGMFFYPEIKDIIGDEKAAKIENELLSYDYSVFTHFNENRHIGENDSYICVLIRDDKIEDFVTFINQHQISLLSKIQPSFLETNNFLIKNQPNLIEYAAFFGSIQIFKFLEINNVKFEPNLWNYAIHGKNPDIIHLLESYEIPKVNFLYEQFFIKSIECHHNDIAKYIEDNLYVRDIYSSREIITQILNNNNFPYYPNPNELNNPYIFSVLSSLKFYKLINFLIKDNEIKIKNIIINKFRFC